MPYRRPPLPLVLSVLLLLVVSALPAGAEVPPQEPPAQAQPPTAAAPAPPPPADVAPPLPSHTIVVRPAPERPPAGPARPPETISLSLRDADLVEVLRSFARLGGFNLVVDPAVKGTVTVELRDVPWTAALAVILRTHGLAAEVDGRIVAIHPLPIAGR
ncbi:MAG TPA: secretin and TonB N-terminal domain-containing protein [Thermoanaerobaculia bacterium]